MKKLNFAQHVYMEAKQNPVVGGERFQVGKKRECPGGWEGNSVDNSCAKCYMYCLYELLVRKPISHYNCPVIPALVSCSLMSLKVNIYIKAVSDCLSSLWLLSGTLRDIPKTALELGHIHDMLITF